MSKIPFRKCMACGAMKEKTELLRLVRTPEGQTVFDPTGKRDGRGAYICKNRDCILRAKKRRIPGKALKTRVPEEILDQLLEETNTE